MNCILRFVRDCEGATAVEYAVILALIMLAIAASIGSVGARTGGLWGTIETDLQNHGFGS
jgi:Flp pilus assembly pilin Flp